MGVRYNEKLRLLFFFVLLSAGALSVVLRYGRLMLSPQNLSSRRTMSSTAGRGAILDRNGRILAIETRFGNVTIWRPHIKNEQTLAKVLSPIINMSENEIVTRINTSVSDFLYLKKHIPQNIVREIEDFSRSDKEGLIDGVNIEDVEGRVYPEQNLASQIIGFVGDEDKGQPGEGLAGIEHSFNEELKARELPSGVIMPGNNVYLTIDANIQYILERVADKALKENNAEAVILTALDPQSGDVLGAVSAPGFDPNNFKESTAEERMFRPAVWAYEPGSVFKIFSLAAFLDSNSISPATEFYCNGFYEKVTNLGERVIIKCLGRHGYVDARKIIVVSCNAGAAYASDRASGDNFYSALKKYGFGSRTATGLSGETAGFLRTPVNWSARTKPTIAMGQEIAVSAMQILKAASAIANEGVLTQPRLVQKIVSADGSDTREYSAGGLPERILKAETSRQMLSYMRDVTSDLGTGWRAAIGDIALAVKTGTAQIIDSNTGLYSETDFIASCIAMLPAASPRLVIYIAIIKPKGESYLGGRIAAPYIRESAEELVNYMGIPRGRNPVVSHSGSILLPQESVPVVNDTIPNFKNYSKRQILPLLLRDDLSFEFKGEGWVVRQSPPPGTKITKDTKIILEFE